MCYLFIYSFIHSFIYIYLFLHSFIPSFIYLYLFIHSFIHSFIFICLFICLFVYLFIYFLFIYLFIYSFIHSYIQTGIHVVIAACKQPEVLGTTRRFGCVKSTDGKSNNIQVNGEHAPLLTRKLALRVRRFDQPIKDCKVPNVPTACQVYLLSNNKPVTDLEF